MTTSSEDQKMVSENKQLKEELQLAKDKLRLIADALKKTCGYAPDLYWYGRSDPHEPRSRSARKMLEKKHPEEVKTLRACKTNWQHGFNSCGSAVYHLFSSILGAEETVRQINESRKENGEAAEATIEEVVERAVKEFPMLDS